MYAFYMTERNINEEKRIREKCLIESGVRWFLKILGTAVLGLVPKTRFENRISDNILFMGHIDRWFNIPAKFGLTSHGEIHLILDYQCLNVEHFYIRFFFFN
jgi:hypothetical protein